MSPTENNEKTGAETSATETQEGLETQDMDASQSTPSEEAPEQEQADKGPDLAKENEELKDKYLRLYAEFENFRRRTAKERFELEASANNRLIAKLTEVLDNFYLAFDPRHKTDKLEDFEKGIHLIFNKFKQVLDEAGLEEVEPMGAEFDPNLHEALMQQPHPEIPENHVIQVLQKGYKVKAKVIKHAKVIVSQGKGQE